MARWLYATMLVTLAGCSVGGSESVLLAGVDLTPSLLEASEVDVQRLAKTDDCVSCHADVASHWESSIHAYASFDNPWYRASVDEFRRERSREESRFCAGFHDPRLLLSGDIDDAVDASNELAYAGVTCLVCHGVKSTRPDGNASFALAENRVLIPDPADPEEIQAHRDTLTMEPLRTAALCGSCHRSFLGPAMGNDSHLSGIDDLGDWASSAYASAVPDHLVSVDRLDCQGCHMPVESASEAEMAGGPDREIRSHHWAASHTALAAQLDESIYAERAHAQLEGAVVVDIGAVRVEGGRYVLPREARLRGSQTLTFDVVLQNERVGHRFPGGVRDLQDSWVEVIVRDATGRVLGASRRDGDGDVFSLRATMLDVDANPELLHRVHRFSAPAFDRTLDAHDARAIRYSIDLPKGIALPLRVDAHLLHRKHSPVFQAAACEASRTARGIEFAAGALLQGKIAIDPCLEEPVTLIGSATAWLGRGADTKRATGGAARPDIVRLLTQALALLHDRQEQVEIARPSIDRAHRLARAANAPDLLARVWVLRARLAAIQGRPNQAAVFTQRAEALVGASPVFDRIRGDAFARVWRWAEAVEAYRRVVDAAPRDHRAWRALAQAYGSLSEDRNALQAANAGLKLAPHDEGLLRSRALALSSLGLAEAEAAKREWLAHRAPDAQPSLLASCERAHEFCHRDRQPIPHYTLTPPTKPFHATVDSR
jgi:tetratricopeptide (TPR) repeat protein